MACTHTLHAPVSHGGLVGVGLGVGVGIGYARLGVHHSCRLAHSYLQAIGAAYLGSRRRPPWLGHKPRHCHWPCTQLDSYRPVTVTVTAGKEATNDTDSESGSDSSNDSSSQNARSYAESNMITQSTA